LPVGKAQVENLSPKFGSEVRGIQLSSLTDAGKDELALFVAQRGVVAFREQDFADLPIQAALDFGGYFGRHHIHPASGQPKGYPEIHLVHRGAEDPTLGNIFETRTSSVAWHSDVTYEKQPPGTSLSPSPGGLVGGSGADLEVAFLYSLDTPTDADGKISGGDTAFVSMVEAYERLSEPFRERLKGLRATHSGVEQSAAAAARGGVVRRPPVIHDHPVVRQHPVTRKKALFVNPQCNLPSRAPPLPNTGMLLMMVG
jgi:sulfonate dioxygenase